MWKAIPTEDAALIETIVNHPAIFPGAIDDNAPFFFKKKSDEHWVLIALSGVLIGMGRATEMKRGTFECHAMILPEFRGKAAIDSARVFFNWIFEALPANCIVTYVSDKYRAGGVYCRSIGLKRVGVLHDFFTHDGICYDATMYSATSEDLGYGRKPR